MNLARGAVVLVGLDPTLGREQQGSRPCVIVSDPEVVGHQRFPLVGVVPVSARAGKGALYPALKPGRSGLSKESFALVDQVRSIDKRRIRRAFGLVSADEMAAIDEGLSLFLGLPSSKYGE